MLAREHTGNDPQPGVVGESLASDPDHDAALGEYRGDRLEPFFLAGSPDPTTGAINPVEVAVTLDRSADHRAVLSDARERFGRRARIGKGNVGVSGYAEIGASVSS